MVAQPLHQSVSYLGFLGFSSAVRQMPGDLYTAPGIISLSHLLATDVTDAIIGASGIGLGTRTGAGGTTTLAKSFFGRSPWLHGQQQDLSSTLSMEDGLKKGSFLITTNTPFCSMMCH